MVLVETVNVDDPEPPVIGFGMKLPEAPEGRPLKERETLPVNPLSGATVAVKVVLPPAVTVFGLPDSESVKSGWLVVPQLGNLKFAMRVFQLKLPLVFMYSSVYQKVQSSTGSTVMAL